MRQPVKDKILGTGQWLARKCRDWEWNRREYWLFTGPETDYHPPLSQPLTTKCFGNLTNVTPAVKDAIVVVIFSQFRICMFYLADTVSGSSFGNSAQISRADMIFAKQYHRRWSYHQSGITCGAIDEPRKSSKAIDKCVIINFRDKNIVVARIATKMRFLF